MDNPLMRTDLRAVDPFAAHPDSREASEAVRPGMGTHQVAWPFTPVDPGEMDEFVSRWTNWFAEAANGQLALPGRMPERPTDGNYELAVDVPAPLRLKVAFAELAV
jgi:hypothetical protein